MARKSLFHTIFKRVRTPKVKIITVRELKSIDPGQPSLAELPEEIILQVVELLQAVSPRSVFKLASTCSFLYKKARYAQNRHVSVVLSSENLQHRLDSMVNDGCLIAVRTLHVHVRAFSDNAPIHDGDAREGRRLTNVSLLSDVIPLMTGLQDIQWEGFSMSTSMLENLRQRPRVQLGLQLDIPDYGVKIPQLLGSLTGSPNLVSIRADVLLIRVKDCAKTMQLLKDLLLSCRNLRKLSLDVHLPRHGCVILNPSEEYCGLGFSNGERPPPLEELDIRGYLWGHEPHTKVDFWTRGYPERGSEVDYWADTFDWSRLRRLRGVSDHFSTSFSSYSVFALKIAPKLIMLEEVGFKRRDGYSPVSPAIAGFFDQLPSVLESISIPTLASVGTAAITRHGPKLRRLEIHQQECTTWRDNAIKPQDLVILCDGLPHLSDLAIDVARASNDWPYDTLNILAGFPRLRRLTLWFERDVQGQETTVPPLLTEAGAGKLFCYLRERLPSLRSVYAYWGCLHRSTRFVCQAAERDDEAARGGIVVARL